MWATIRRYHARYMLPWRIQIRTDSIGHGSEKVSSPSPLYATFTRAYLKSLISCLWCWARLVENWKHVLNSLFRLLTPPRIHHLTRRTARTLWLIVLISRVSSTDWRSTYDFVVLSDKADYPAIKSTSHSHICRVILPKNSYFVILREGIQLLTGFRCV